MACYDCEDCNKHINKGGKCNNWEYNCPFRHLESWGKGEQEEKNKDLETAKNLNSDLKLLIDKYKNEFVDWFNYEETIKGLEKVQDNLDYMINDCVKEWNKINS